MKFEFIVGQNIVNFEILENKAYQVNVLPRQKDPTQLS
jgi:hypothetical protein